MTHTLTTVAWHGDPELKDAAVERMRAHRAEDTLIQGGYVSLAPGTARGYMGCWHGCLTVEALAAEQGITIMELVDVTRNGDEINFHEEGERLFGIPRRLGALLDRLFEQHNDFAEVGAFAVATVEAMPVGADLSRVVSAWVLDMLRDPIGDLAAATSNALSLVVGLHQRVVDGGQVSQGEWTTASNAADDAQRVVGTSMASRHVATAAEYATGEGSLDEVVVYMGHDLAWATDRLVHHLKAA
jgi:hypothetical protein